MGLQVNYLAAAKSQGVVAEAKLLRGGVFYRDVDAWLDDRTVPTDLVMVNNPPSFYYHTGRSSVVVPAEGPDTLVEICDRYGVRFVVLDRNIVPELVPLYKGEVRHPRLPERAHFREDTGRLIIIYEVLEKQHGS